MKKNKLTFIVVASFLALSAIAGCDANTPSKNSSKGADNSVLPSSDIGGDTSQGGVNSQSSQGGDNTSQGGGGNTSQGGGNTSQGGGNEKTDWTNDEKAMMSRYLHGLVLPFVEMDVNVRVSQDSGTVRIQSQQNMASGFLAGYKAKLDADPAWVGQDISSEYNAYPGNAFYYQRPVVENGNTYYVAVFLAGLQFVQGQEEPNVSKDGVFYLEAFDPYVYEFPSAFINQWLAQSFGTNIFPPAFEADFYSLDSEGVLIGYNETNIENSYKATLETSGKFTIDPEKNAQGFYVVHPTDGTYIMYFMYDTTQKIMILKVDVPKGWNNAAINKIFNDNNVTPFSLGSVSDPNITFAALESAVGEATYMFINVGGINVEGVQAYVNSLKALGYKVAYPTVTVDSNQYFTTANVITNEGMFTIYVTYSTAENANNLQIYFSLTPNTTVVKDWPAASIARYIDAEHDTVPTFGGIAYGYSYAIEANYNYAHVVVILDNGAENAAKDSYITTLTSPDNGYTAHGTLGGQPAFLSPNSEILVAIGCDPTDFPGQIDILIQQYVVVETPWPSEDIADAISGLATLNPITDVIPVLSVGSASSCTVNDNYNREKFDIYVDGLASSESDFIGDFKTAGWTEDAYYEFDTMSGAYGALISPNKQLVAYFDTYSNDLIITVKSYFEPFSYPWPSQDINQILQKWDVKFDTLPSFERASAEVQEDISKQELTIFVNVADSLKQRVITDYCVALEAIGYHFDRETLHGHVSNNHELLIKFESDANGVKIIVSCIKIIYKVVGYNNGDWSFANGMLMTVTPEEGDYKIQYQASFHVDANAKFKVLDSENNWYGGLNNFAKYSNANNDIFSIQENGDIKVNAAGTVTVYFKIYDDNSKDMWLEFTADPVAASWPTDQINAALEGWGVTDEIPALQDASISDIQFSGDEDSFTLSILGGGGLAGSYQATLLETYSEDPDTHKLISPSGKLSVDVHANADELVVVVELVEEEQPELKPWPQEALATFFGDGVDYIPELKIPGASFEAEEPETNDEGKFFGINVTVENAPAAMEKAIQDLAEYYYSYDSDAGYYISSLENYPRFYFEDGDANSFYVEISVGAKTDPVQDTVYKLVGSFSNWSYDDVDSDELQVLDPEEGYLAQYSIYFEIFAGEEFKICDGSGDSGWVGGEALNVNQYSEWFEVLSGGNIKAKQDGMVDLAFDILSDGTKKITIQNFEPEFEDGTWAKARYDALQDNPDAEIPNLEIEGASGYVYNHGNGSIDISFIEGADLSNLPLSLSSQLEAAGFHYTARFEGFVKISANTLLGIGFNGDGTLSIYPGTFDFANDSGYGVVIFAYDEIGDYYYDDDEIIGIVNPENSNEYVVTYSFEEGMYFIIYDYSNEIEFEVTVDPASGVTNDGSFADYFEYDVNTNMFRVKQDFEGTIYIKLIYGNDQIYVAITNPNP